MFWFQQETEIIQNDSSLKEMSLLSFCLIVACMCVFRERTSRQAHAPVRAKKEDSEGTYLIFSGLIQWG